MSDESVVADRYRRLAERMTDTLRAIPDDAWARPTPCEDWDVRALAGHLVEVHGIFQRLAGRTVADHPDPAADPVGAWVAVRDQTQADLDDPARRDTEYDSMFGRTTFGASVDGFVCFDLVLHRWDLARATGQDEAIDPEEVERLSAMVGSMQSTMLEQGVIDTPVEPPPDASDQERLLASVGRDPRT